MKTICPPGYHHNDFVATRALGHMMYGYTVIYIYIYKYIIYIYNIYIYIYIYIYMYMYIYIYIYIYLYIRVSYIYHSLSQNALLNIFAYDDWTEVGQENFNLLFAGNSGGDLGMS